MGGPDTNDDFDDALREGWGGNHQNDDVIYEWVLSGLKVNCVATNGGVVIIKDLSSWLKSPYMEI